MSLYVDTSYTIARITLDESPAALGFIEIKPRWFSWLRSLVFGGWGI